MRYLLSRPTFVALVVLVGPEAFEGSSSGNELMRELSLVLRVVVSSIGTVNLLSSVLRFTLKGCQFR